MAISNGTDDSGVYQLKPARKSAVLHRHLHHVFPEVARGEGNHLILKDGRRIFDASGGAAVVCVGVSWYILPLSADCILSNAAMPVSLLLLLLTAYHCSMQTPS